MALNVSALNAEPLRLAIGRREFAESDRLSQLSRDASSNPGVRIFGRNNRHLNLNLIIQFLHKDQFRFVRLTNMNMLDDETEAGGERALGFRFRFVHFHSFFPRPDLLAWSSLQICPQLPPVKVIRNTDANMEGDEM